MVYTVGVITLSDKGSRGERTDTSGDAAVEIFEAQGLQVVYRSLLPDDLESIKAELIKCSDQLGLALICTTGGTGFSKRDVTPEATLAIIERSTRGIPEAMRAESMKFTDKAMLSRAEAGIRGNSLIVNLPGSEKAVRECLHAVISPLKHGIEILQGEVTDCGSQTDQSVDCQPVDGKWLESQSATVLAVCISENKGEQKYPISQGQLIANHGLEGDAHAGNHHRQVSLLAVESVRELQKNTDFIFEPGAFAENILTEGMDLHRLPVGTKLRIGQALCEVSQIGKECHKGCAIREKTGDCVMPREGVFVRVLGGGKVKVGDTVLLY